MVYLMCVLFFTLPWAYNKDDDDKLFVRHVMTIRNTTEVAVLQNDSTYNLLSLYKFNNQEWFINVGLFHAI